MTDGWSCPDATLLITDLQERLDRAADEQTRAWFENYLKHAICYRGIKSPEVTRIVALWRHEHDLQQLPDRDALALAASLIRQTHAEDKFAGIFYIQKFLQKRIGADTLLDTAECLFTDGAFFDWSTTDWFCVRVLGPLIKHHGHTVAGRIASWCRNSGMWHRRASIVPFRSVIGDQSFHPLVDTTIATLVREQERFIQTGIGWVVSDLSKTHPNVAEMLIERHLDDLSAEVIRRHTRHLPQHNKYKAKKRDAP